MSSPENKIPIKGVHVFSTGTGSLHAEHINGTSLPRLIWALFSRSWVDIPINFFAIEHPQGLVLFDTGLDPGIQNDREYIKDPIVRFLMGRLFMLKMNNVENLAKKLAKKGLEVSEVKKVVISHLHFDHVGGVSQVPQAKFFISRAEWKKLSEPHPEREFIFREHIDIPGARWTPIDFNHTRDPLFEPFGGYYDLMDDGSLILLPTPGHTPGSLSMLVRVEGKNPLLLVGDLAYNREMLMEDRVPGIGEKEQLLATFKKVRSLQKKLPGMVILTAHDFLNGDISDYC